MSAEKEVRLRLASRSSRFAREAGIEIVRRTPLIGSYELGGMTSQPTMRGSAPPPAVLRSVFDRVVGRRGWARRSRSSWPRGQHHLSWPPIAGCPASRWGLFGKNAKNVKMETYSRGKRASLRVAPGGGGETSSEGHAWPRRGAAATRRDPTRQPWRGARSQGRAWGEASTLAASHLSAESMSQERFTPRPA